MSSLRARLARAGLLLGASGCLLPAISFAQGASAGASASTSSGLQEIVVTAERRSESLQKVAVPVTAVSGSEITNRSVTTISDLGRLVPAVQIESGAGSYTGVSLRGIATTSLNAFADPAIAVNMDGIYLPRPTSMQGLFYDIDRVEVLKGPQGTLYGRNATGGAINVISKAPDTWRARRRSERRGRQL